MVSIPGRLPASGPPKTKASRRTVPVPEFPLDQLALHLGRFLAGAGELVFEATKRKGPMLRTALHARWARLVGGLGLPKGTRFHELRHDYVSVFIHPGESVKAVRERLGHAGAVETLKTHVHLWPSSDERTRRVVERAWADSADSVRISDHAQASDRRE